MNPRVGLAAPFVAVAAFAVVYLPISTHFLPAHGWFKLPFSPQSFFLISTLVILRVRKLPFAGIGFSKVHALKNTRLGILLALIPVGITLAAAWVLTETDSFFPFLKRPIFGGEPSAAQVQVYQLVTLLLLAPIAEEFFFRGILLKALREHYAAWLSVIGSSLIFMGAHGHLALGPLVLGVINAILMLRTGSIIPGMVFHAVANTYGPAMLTWFPNLYWHLEFFYR